MIFEKVTHIIEKLCKDTQFQQAVLGLAPRNRKLADIRKLPLEYRLAFLVLWGTPDQDDPQKNIRTRLPAGDLDVFLHLHQLNDLTEEFEFWIIDDPQAKLVDLVARPKEGTIQTLLSKYLGDVYFSEKYGERVPNCREILSEALPTITDPSYYQRMAGKRYRSLGGSGDGYRIRKAPDLQREKIEVKFTSSGGARQTFSPAQIEENDGFLVLAVEPQKLRKQAKCWHASDGKVYKLEIISYETNEGFHGLCNEEVRAKNARRKTGGGTGRYEISNMIAKIEEGGYYKEKARIMITPRAISTEREIL